MLNPYPIAVALPWTLVHNKIDRVDTAADHFDGVSAPEVCTCFIAMGVIFLTFKAPKGKLFRE